MSLRLDSVSQRESLSFSIGSSLFLSHPVWKFASYGCTLNFEVHMRLDSVLDGLMGPGTRTRGALKEGLVRCRRSVYVLLWGLG